MVMDTVHLIQDVAQWIWDKTATIRAVAAEAWTWLKNKIGIGEGPEGQNGILQWVQRKLEAAWDWLKEKLAPFKKQITTVAAIVGGVLLRCRRRDRSSRWARPSAARSRASAGSPRTGARATPSSRPGSTSRRH